MTEFTQDFANQVAETALQHYQNHLPQKAKPKDSEWTVYAAIVAADETDMWVVSSATGTKCCVVPKDCRSDNAGLCVLTDCHAEVLARRGLQRVLYSDMKPFRDTIEKKASDCQSFDSSNRKSLLKQVQADIRSTSPATKDSVLRFRLKDDVTLHLYVSDSPCGDASIYLIRHQAENGVCDANIQFTGAKVIVSEGTNAKPFEFSGPLVQNVSAGVQLVREQQDQLHGKLRTKSGRSNLEPHLRSQSMSCSDKIVRWVILGLQGGVLEAALQDPIRLSTVVVSQDPRADRSSQINALKRSIIDRAEASLHHLNVYTKELDGSDTEIVRFVETVSIPSIFVVDACFRSGKSASLAIPTSSATPSNKKRKLNVNHAPTCGHCSNWQVSSHSVEIVIGARGLRQGPKPKSQSDYVKHSSRLCRQSLAQEALIIGLLDPQSIRCLELYRNQKRRCLTCAYRSVREFLLTNGPLAGWLIGDGR